MTSTLARTSLPAFLSEIGPEIDTAVAVAVDRAHSVAAYLASHLAQEPAIAAQIEKFREALPPTLAGQPFVQRQAAVRAARGLLADIKSRWIAADDPPIVDEIDDRLTEIATELTAIERPHVEALKDAARRIDELSEIGRSLDGIERRLTVPAVVATVLFVAGIVLFFEPNLLLAVPALASFWTIMLCLGALPALATYYAVKTRPRAHADAEIDRLNRDFFLPNGGIYFPPGPGEACVMRVDWTPPPEDLPLDKAPRDPRKRREKIGPLW